MSTGPKAVKDGRAVVFVLSQVTVQVCLLAKAPFTKMTFVWFLLVVDISHVTLQVRGNRERSFTELTLVRLFTSVGAQVPCQVGRPGESFATILAAIPFFVLFCQTGAGTVAAG